VATDLPGIVLRDSKNPSGPKLMLTQAEFAAFADAVRRGTYDL
jgi:hypothetical protein